MTLACARTSGGGSRGRNSGVGVGDRVRPAGIVSELAHSPERRAIVPSVLTIGESEQSGTPIVDRVTRDGASVVVLDRDAQGSERVVEQAIPLHAQGIRVRTVSLFYEQWLGKLPVTELERVSLLFDIGEVHSGGYVRVKRLTDVAFALVGLVALVVLLPLVVIGDLAANRGPLFYRQVRVGKNGAVFTILKFRTMRPGPTGPADEWTAEGDDRITPFGHFLRVSHLDELPQVINVLQGDLAIVGPRPEQPHYVEMLSDTLPFYGVRHLVRPGITGWAQVKYGYAGDERDALEKLQYDFYYLRPQGITLDLRIVGRTVRSVLGRGGR